MWFLWVFTRFHGLEYCFKLCHLFVHIVPSFYMG
ncbi:hypothetical protein AMTRI_Chr03g54360 [Amborella trichopoda]